MRLYVVLLIILCASSCANHSQKANNINSITYENWNPHGKSEPKLRNKPEMEEEWEEKMKSDLSIRGVWKGWSIIRENQKFKGIVTGADFYGGSWVPSVPYEADWNIFILPNDPESYELLKIGDYLKDHNHIEVEVEPIPQFANKEAIERFMKPAIGQEITVFGTYVDDDAHSPKPEIHPVKSLLYTDKAGDYHFLAFADNSGNRGWGPGAYIYVPHAKEAQETGFDLKLPVPWAEFSIVEEINMAASKSIYQDGDIIRCRVNTGKPDEGQGFYYAKFRFTVMEPPCPCYTCNCICTCACRPEDNPCHKSSLEPPTKGSAIDTR